MYSYPEDLDERQYAFDGTVMSVEKGDYVRDAGHAATGDTMDVMGCGFTRPYSAEEAERWRTTFGG